MDKLYPVAGSGLPSGGTLLAQLDVASSPEAMRLPHYRLHALKGKLKGYWSVTVKTNWRIIFRFEGEDVYDVELIDYH